MKSPSNPRPTPNRIWMIAVLVFTMLSVGVDAEESPDIVFVIADDLGYLDAGFMGNPDVQTPALDELAEQSMQFHRMYVASPTCAPSRGALLSGLMPFRNGAEPNHSLVRDDVKQLPRYFKDLGYQVASFGKITHGKDKRAGFDVDDRRFSFENTQMVDEFLANRKGIQPLLMMVGIKDPHVPWPDTPDSNCDPAKLTPHQQLIDTPQTRFHLARYYSDVQRMDQQLAAVLRATKQHLGSDTIVIFTSDHGAQLPFGKWNNYDYSLRVPFLVHWPGVTKAGVKSNALISFVDILPTLIEIAGGKPPSAGFGSGQIDGRSFADLLRGQTDQHRETVFSTNSSAAHHTYPLRSVRTRRFRYVMNVVPEWNFTTQTDHNPSAEGHAMWKSWIAKAKSDPEVAQKLREYHRRPAEELYDLESDPSEQRNLAADPGYEAVKRRHRRLLNQWIRQSGDTLQRHGPPMDVLLEVPATHQSKATDSP
ncbi:Choline-sulfatase [Crateriforma conspicua]|uniref:Choline-sulfatase n=1 Tax=Crateriforma conspicua TaxID=2527996 RepID=A0A5C6FP65_9PLAN|nr:sulfatase [Crateriforma conspicua]TWU64719.1 Choline-sulfatase [Crateriforma conspicua]